MSIILKYLITFFVGMVPILELRGAIPIGVGLGLSYFEAFICSFIGNIVPIYFIVKFIRPLFDFFGRWKPFKIIIDWATERATRKIEESEKLQSYTALGLFLFVAVPLPGTGAWVGSLIANFLNLPPKKAIPPIIAGVLVAGIIVLAVTAAANGGIHNFSGKFKFSNVEFSTPCKCIANIVILISVYGSYLYLRLKKARTDKRRKQR